ncbi:MAG TPA: FHA domain-containing serine/threonine-protein kinase [Pyrinomonadaceae bacterium]|nr:FHA domain-containing serine/threonine-protein kinase [Pyrinomonadaceae bacterium]
MPECRVCDLEVAEDQESCPSCGAVQEPVVELSSAPPFVGDNDVFATDVEDITDTEESASPKSEKINTNESLETVVEGDAGTASVARTETDGKKPGLSTLSEGSLLNSRYKIGRKIGGGGMGAVYIAEDQNLGGVERAVKEMVQSSIEEEQQRKAIEDFRRESMILSSLDHPSIPTIYDYFFDESQGRFYLVMKYISGGDLSGRLRATPAGRIDERAVTDWAMQITDVLAYLHGLPSTIVYRDLKPSNIMLDGNTGRVMLIDFGIARAINAEEKGVTAVGTMGYAPPELFSGQVEPRSDIYSLGATMFHLLTGADPQNNPLLIFDFQKNPRPRQINPQLSDQMERILMRSVEYNADHRFTSAEEMRRVLSEHMENIKRGAVTYGVTETPAAVSLSNQSVFCGFCGQRIIATDLFCAFCGSKQPIAQHGVHAEIYRPGLVVGRTAKLVIEGTSELDAPIFSLEKPENLVGRRDPMANIFPEVDLSRYDPQTKISRRHARIWRDGDTFMVEDLGSSNGTMLLASPSESVRLQPHQPYSLGNGDRLRMGDTTLHFLKG